MKKEVEDFYKRIKDLSEQSYQKGRYIFTSFLSMAEVSDFYNMCILPPSSPYALAPSGFTVNGGYEGAERCMIRFGNPDELMYEEPFPLACIKISPVNSKFAEALSHRDFLGSLMNLGIKRELLGDILVKNSCCYVFADEKMADMICREITRVKHTTVITEICNAPEAEIMPEYKEMNIQVNSPRIDAVVAKVYKLSRSQAADLFFEKKIFVNGRMMENESHQLVVSDVISVRGYGKFVFDRLGGNTKKGNQILGIKIYI